MGFRKSIGMLMMVWTLAACTDGGMPPGDTQAKRSNLSGGSKGATAAVVYGETTARIKAAPGEMFHIELGSNPSTGYSWQVAPGVEDRVIHVVSDVYQAPGTSMPGKAGKQVWTLQAGDAGTTRLTFEYRRAWEKNVPAAKVHTVDITVGH